MSSNSSHVLGNRALEFYRDLFPITRERVYLNHASLGVLSSLAVEAMSRHLFDHSERGSHTKPEWQEMKQRVRGKMAAFVGAEPGEIAITKNTPDSLSILAAGLPWKPGERVVITDLEFPANAHPWLNLAKQGVEVITVQSRGGCVPTEDLVAVMDHRTRLVSLSWVQFSTGYRSDLDAVGRACREKGIYFAVDAIQGLGALRFDVRELNVDFFGAASHKWLCGPTGVGWFYCRRELMDAIEVRVVGQASYERDPHDSWLDYKTKLWPDARRFEPGLVNFLGLAGLEAALDLLLEVSIESVEARIKRLTDILVQGLLERGFRLAAPRSERDWSGIVSFASERWDSLALLQRLEMEGVSASVHDDYIRVSPHFYNTDEEIERLLRALP